MDKHLPKELLKLLVSDNSNELFGLPEDYEQLRKGAAPDVLMRLGPLMESVFSEVRPAPVIRFEPVRAKTTVFDTKLGGVPYLPKGSAYPTVKEGEHEGKPLRLLAQLNFSKLPHLAGFPEVGILQFFAGCDGDELYGVSFENGFDQNRFRIIYHCDIIENEAELCSAAEMPSFAEENVYPFVGEFLLKVTECGDAGITESDFRFDDVFTRHFNRMFGKNAVGIFDFDGDNGIEDIDIELYDALFEYCVSEGCCVGGYPYFTQEDPRRYNEDYAKCDTLLFQLDSEGEIMWGDSGVGNFFISAEALENCDFSRVLYNWDCC